MTDVIEIMTPIVKIINNGNEFLSFSPEESDTESCFSPFNETSTGGRTSQDISEFPSSSEGRTEMGTPNYFENLVIISLMRI